MTGNTRLTTAPSQLTHCSRGGTHTPSHPGAVRAAIMPQHSEGITPKKRLELPAGARDPRRSPALTDSACRFQSGKAETASGVAVAAAPAELRVPEASPRPVPRTAPAPQLCPLAHWLG